MGVSFLMWLTLNWVIAGLLAGAMSLAFGDQFTTFNAFLQFDVFTTKTLSFFGADLNAPWLNIAWFGALADFLTFDYAFLKGDMNIVRMIVFLVVVGAAVYASFKDFGTTIVSMAGVLGQGITAVAGGIGSLIGSLVRRF